jgi:predicted dehydrogenase
MKQMTKVRWGLIGCGDIAQKRVAPALRNLVLSEFVAVSRAQSDLAESFAKQFGAKRWYSDWHDMLRDGEIDALYIATPVHLHAAQTVAAAEAGKHVLCEKPMALNVAECEQMIAACRANNVKLGIAYYRHFYPVIHRIKRLIESGEIGDPVLVQINAFEWFNPMPEHPRSWLLNRQLAGGGPMFDFGCHRIEVLLDVFGGIRNVKATVANVLFDREVEDTAAAVFQFDRGTCGMLTVSHAAYEPQDSLDVFGSRGSIHVAVLNEGNVRVKNEKGERTESHPPAANFHQPLIEDFMGAILEDREPAVGGEAGRQVASIEEQIYATTAKGLGFIGKA